MILKAMSNVFNTIAQTIRCYARHFAKRRVYTGWPKKVNHYQIIKKLCLGLI